MTETESPKPGKVVIVSGPSGAGKGTVLKRLLETCPLPLEISVSATTRRPRSGERDGVDYHFLKASEFHKLRSQGQFLECMEVFSSGDWYGTPGPPVAESVEKGNWVILEIDVAGAGEVLKKCPDAITIFIHPGSREELERRLRGRKTESADAIQRRLAIAATELKKASSYQHVLVNRNIDSTAEKLCDLLCKARESSCTTN